MENDGTARGCGNGGVPPASLPGAWDEAYEREVDRWIVAALELLDQARHFGRGLAADLPPCDQPACP